ncbi:MAG: hypothetical protein ACLQBA_22755 [Candidatus Binataceae bacterium]
MSAPIPHREREMHHFLMLTADEQRAAIVKLAAAGMSDHTIASASGLAVEMVRKILGEQRAKATAP